jgi:hypothetical protein
MMSDKKKARLDAEAQAFVKKLRGDIAAGQQTTFCIHGHLRVRTEMSVDNGAVATSEPCSLYGGPTNGKVN